MTLNLQEDIWKKVFCQTVQPVVHIGTDPLDHSGPLAPNAGPVGTIGSGMELVVASLDSFRP